MAQRFPKIIVVLILFSFPIFGLAQNKTMQEVIAQRNFEMAKWNAQFMPQYVKTATMHINYSSFSFPQQKTTTAHYIRGFNPYLLSAVQPLPSNYYVQHFGFFCNQEFKFQKITHLPLHFRLGSMSYTDWMESKPNAKKPN